MGLGDAGRYGTLAAANAPSGPTRGVSKAARPNRRWGRAALRAVICLLCLEPSCHIIASSGARTPGTPFAQLIQLAHNPPNP
jgi:hypothetical protein